MSTPDGSYNNGQKKSCYKQSPKGRHRWNLLEARTDELLGAREENKQPGPCVVLVDAARLQRARMNNLFQPIDPKARKRTCRESRASQGNWFGPDPPGLG